MHISTALLGSLYYASEWAIRLAMLVYVPQRRDAAATRTWLLLIFLLPWPGLALYLLFGRIRVPQRRREEQARASLTIRQDEARLLARRTLLGAVPDLYGAAARLVTATGQFAPFAGNQVELIDDYAGAVARLIADIDRAERHAHLLFYIFGDDATGRSVADALARAARRGVQCRVLMDAVGARRGLERLAPTMRAQGIQVRAMLPVGLFRRNAARFDLRNHRKLAVVDGRVAYTGSQNIVDPTFIADHPNEELMARVTGPVVSQLQAVFLSDWFFETGERLNVADVVSDFSATGVSTAQVLPSGPGYPRENARDLLITLFNAAQTSVVITTPYFVPDDPFLQAMCSAATRGVIVDLVVSKQTNQLISRLAQGSYYEALLAVGVRIHLYRPRFLHAKHVSIDDQVVVLSTTNMDIRSFALNAELSLLVFDPVVAAELRRVQDRYFAKSDLLDATEWARRPLFAKVTQNVARLADSFL